MIAGHDVVREPHLVRPLINMVSGGESSGYGLLTVRENLWMFAQFYGIPTAQANHRIQELLAIVGLSDRANTKSSELSTGLRQKMNIVRGFLTDPQVLFLDEPTLGLDVGASRDVRAFIRAWVTQDRARTLLLTTHYMVEADELCDRVAIINRGRVLACDTPANLKRQLQRDVIFEIETTPFNGMNLHALEALGGVRRVVQCANEASARWQVHLADEGVVGAVINTLTAHPVRLLTLRKHEPTLEDVFVDLVGRSMSEVEHEEEPR
jgi:ABC-2 type transport system ATP-binding protein